MFYVSIIMFIAGLATTSTTLFFALFKDIPFNTPVLLFGASFYLASIAASLLIKK